MVSEIGNIETRLIRWSLSQVLLQNDITFYRRYDNVEVFDGPTDSDTLLGRHCGSDVSIIYFAFYVHQDNL